MTKNKPDPLLADRRRMWADRHATHAYADVCAEYGSADGAWFKCLTKRARLDAVLARAVRRAFTGDDATSPSHWNSAADVIDAVRDLVSEIDRLDREYVRAWPREGVSG